MALDLGQVEAQTDFIRLNGRQLVGYRAGSKLPAKSQARRDSAYLKIVHAQSRARALESELETSDELRRDEIASELEQIPELIEEANVLFLRSIVPGLSQSEAELIAGDEDLYEQVRAHLGYNDRTDESPESPKEEEAESSPAQTSTSEDTSDASPDSAGETQE